MRMSGVVRMAGEAVVLTDETTNVTAELRGEDLEDSLGSRVTVTGTLAEDDSTSDSAEHVIDVDGVEELDQDGGNDSATDNPGNSSNTKPAGKTKGTSAKTYAIVGGVAAGGATAGLLYVTGDSNNEEQPISR